MTHRFRREETNQAGDWRGCSGLRDTTGESLWWVSWADLRKSRGGGRGSLVVQWLTICLSIQVTRVRSLVQEDHTCCRASKPASHNYWSARPTPCEVKETEASSVMSDSLRPHGLYSSWNSPGQNTGVGTLSLLQGIFPTQGLNPGLLHCRWILYQLSYQGSPKRCDT